MSEWDKLSDTTLHKPTLCEKCGKFVTYKGLGEYICECGYTMYDDYGKVRKYLEINPTANIVRISADTGVPRDSIREMIEQDKFIVTNKGRYLS